MLPILLLPYMLIYLTNANLHAYTFTCGAEKTNTLYIELFITLEEFIISIIFTMDSVN